MSRPGVFSPLGFPELSLHDQGPVVSATKLVSGSIGRGNVMTLRLLHSVCIRALSSPVFVPVRNGSFIQDLVQ